MFPYFALAGVTVFLSGLNRATILTLSRFRRSREAKAKRATWTMLDFIVVGILIAFSGLRWQVGTDYDTYVLLFENMRTTHWAEQLQASPQEVGYTLLALVIRQFSATPEPLFWVTSAVTVIPVYLALKKSSVDMTMSLALYILLAFYVSPFNIIRQGIAISLNFWASTFIDSNKKAFIIINAVAASFHATALFAALIQLAIHKKGLNVKWFTFVIFGAILVAVSLPRLGPVLSFLDLFNDRYDNYLLGASAGLGTYLLILSRLGLGLYGVALGRSENYARYGLFVLVGVAFLIVGTQAIILSRMQSYFGIFLLLLLPNQIAGTAHSTLHKTVIYVACAIYFWFHLQNWGGLIPYQIAR